MHPAQQHTAVTAAELLYANGCMPGCDSALIGPLAAGAFGRWYCIGWQGHEDYEIDHHADDGTTW